MPKKLTPDLADRLLAEIGRHPHGISAKQLSRVFAREGSPRSLGRLLARLAGRDRIVVQGAGRATRYQPKP
ncbi:MAG: hypothetical protein ACREUO_07550, partial [Burkholderiales bacterium]